MRWYFCRLSITGITQCGRVIAISACFRSTATDVVCEFFGILMPDWSWKSSWGEGGLGLGGNGWSSCGTVGWCSCSNKTPSLRFLWLCQHWWGCQIYIHLPHYVSKAQFIKKRSNLLAKENPYISIDTREFAKIPVGRNLPAYCTWRSSTLTHTRCEHRGYKFLVWLWSSTCLVFHIQSQGCTGSMG